MLKYKLISLFFVGISITTSVKALDIQTIASSAVSNLMGNNTGSSTDITSMLSGGNLPFEISCDDPDVDVDFGTLSDMCGAYSGAESQTSAALSALKKGFTFGGCSAKGNTSNSCRSSMIKKMCGNVNDGGKTLFGTASSSVGSKENMLYSGGDVYMKGNLCDFDEKSILGEEIKYGKKTNRQVEDEYLAPSIIASKSEVGGASAFWKPGKLNLYETCIKNALNNGAKNPESSCKGEFYALPETRLAAEEQTARTAKVSLMDSTSGLGQKVSDIEKTLKSSAYPQCTNVQDGDCVDSSYVNNVKANMDKMIKAEELDKIKQTEEEMSNFQEHVKIATMPKYEITHPTQEVLNGLHPEQKGDFVVLANKQMHQKALFNSSIQNLTELKKELIEISFKKAELSSKTFYPSAALDEARKIMDKGY